MTHAHGRRNHLEVCQKSSAKAKTVTLGRVGARSAEMSGIVQAKITLVEDLEEGDSEVYGVEGDQQVKMLRS